MPDVAPAQLLVHDLLRTQAQGRPLAPAVIEGDRIVTFTELERMSGRISRQLREAGIILGDRVVVQASQTVEAYATWFAVSSIGAVLVPFSPVNTPAEVEFAVGDCRASLLLREADLLKMGRGDGAALAEPPDLDELSPALIRYSSGTTDGRAKGIVLSHRSLVLTFWLEAIEFGHCAGSVFLACLPWNGAGGFFTLSHLAVGGCAVLMPRFEVDAFWAAAVRHRATHALVVPTMAVRLLSAPSPADVSIGTVVSTGAALADSVRRRLADHCRGDVIDCYGSTETEIALVRRAGDPAGLGRNSVASLLRILDSEGGELADGESGEIAKRGPDVFSGYWERPALTLRAVTDDGYVRTGDIGMRSPDGSIVISDRRDDLIVTGGNNVAPAEVESALLELPAVLEVAVVGRIDDEWGEVPIAVVVLHPDSLLTADDMAGHCGIRLARHKIPHEFLIVDKLPHSPAGKVLRRVVRDGITRQAHQIKEESQHS